MVHVSLLYLTFIIKTASLYNIFYNWSRSILLITLNLQQQRLEIPNQGEHGVQTA